MPWDEAPEQYWHCYVAIPGRKRDRDRAVVNDLGKEQLKREVIDPWHEARAFTVGGTIIRDRDSVEEIRIVHTPRPKEGYVREHESRMRASGIADLATDRRFLPFGRGTDFTHELLFDALQTTAPAPMLRHCCACAVDFKTQPERWRLGGKGNSRSLSSTSMTPRICCTPWSAATSSIRSRRSRWGALGLGSRAVRTWRSRISGP